MDDFLWMLYQVCWLVPDLYLVEVNLLEKSHSIEEIRKALDSFFSGRTFMIDSIIYDCSSKIHKSISHIKICECKCKSQ